MDTTSTASTGNSQAETIDEDEVNAFYSIRRAILKHAVSVKFTRPVILIGIIALAVYTGLLTWLLQISNGAQGLAIVWNIVSAASFVLISAAILLVFVFIFRQLLDILFFGQSTPEYVRVCQTAIVGARIKNLQALQRVAETEVNGIRNVATLAVPLYGGAIVGLLQSLEMSSIIQISVWGLILVVFISHVFLIQLSNSNTVIVKTVHYMTLRGPRAPQLPDPSVTQPTVPSSVTAASPSHANNQIDPTANP